MKSARNILVLLVLLICAAGAYGEQVKKSNAGICHDQSSPHYSRVTHYTAFQELDDCLDAGGRLPVRAGRPSEAGEGYDRSKFGSGWADLSRNCRNSRMEALIEQSTVPVTFRTERECVVVSGRWISPYTGKVIHDASEIDIDHIVPLRWAWEHGADQWDQEKRIRFANDPINLWSVEASLNRQKGSKGPEDWLPPVGRCQYIARFTRIVRIYQINLPVELQQHHRQITRRYCS